LSATIATSAGGIVIRFLGDKAQFVAGRRRRERDGMTWTLPKGTPIPGETLEETALREVAEETGLEVRVVAPLDSIKYTFVQRGTRVRKTVHYFLMQPVGGSLDDHDREFEEVRWVAFDDAPGLLSFETEKALVGLAAERLPEFRSAVG
jgi:8-oxo-dGTP pyrophosphatase MutT (NUDIX family)